MRHPPIFNDFTPLLPNRSAGFSSTLLGHDNLGQYAIFDKSINTLRKQELHAQPRLSEPRRHRPSDHYYNLFNLINVVVVRHLRGIVHVKVMCPRMGLPAVLFAKPSEKGYKNQPAWPADAWFVHIEMNSPEQRPPKRP